MTKLQQVARLSAMVSLSSLGLLVFDAGGTTISPTRLQQSVGISKTDFFGDQVSPGSITESKNKALKIPTLNISPPDSNPPFDERVLQVSAFPDDGGSLAYAAAYSLILPDSVRFRTDLNATQGNDSSGNTYGSGSAESSFRVDFSILDDPSPIFLAKYRLSFNSFIYDENYETYFRNSFSFKLVNVFEGVEYTIWDKPVIDLGPGQPDIRDFSIDLTLYSGNYYYIEAGGRMVEVIEAGVDGRGWYEFSLAPVPEPGTYALMLVGLCAVGYWGRQRVR